MDAAIHARFTTYMAVLGENAPSGYGFTTTQGRKYTKIVMTYNGGQRSVHAFVDDEGQIYKSAGWQRPAEGVRFSLSNDVSFARLLEAASGKQAFAGGYLYIR